MSRIGDKPIIINNNISIKINNNCVTIKGKKGIIKKIFSKKMKILVNKNYIIIKRSDDTKKTKSLHGLTRTLIKNMIIGVTIGYKKILEINGIGYKAIKKNNKLILYLGYSHSIIMNDPDNCKSFVENNRIIIKGIDKEKVGQYAAEIKNKKKPEPYKGKGIKYINEVIKRKVGKIGKK